MSRIPGFRCVLAIALFELPSLGATFGTVVPHTAPVADIALDEARKRLYVLNATASPPTVDIYNLGTKPPSPALGTSSIAVDPVPLSMAMSPARSGTLGSQFLYVACYTSSTLDVINLDTMSKVNTVRLSANPESVAVGFDGKVLISTIGTSTGTGILAIYDPNASSTASALTAVVVAPAAPTAPTLPAPNDNAYLAGHSRMVATANGATIIGVHEQAASRAVWVYDVASETVLRSRTLTNTGSNASPPTGILAVAPDGSRFISGSILFDTASLLVLAQQSTSNAPFTFTAGSNFATQTTQGGAVFLPDGSALLTAYNIVPVLSPAAQVNTSQLLVNAPTNLLVRMGYQLPEQLSGKMTITSDGAAIYAISESGFMQLPIGTLAQTSPIATPDTNVAFLATDQCGVTAALNSATIPVRNAGGGKMTITAQVLSSTSTSVNVKAAAASYGGNVTVQINSTVSKTLGTAAPDQLLIQSPEAVNIIPAVRVYQNNRNSEARGSIVAVDTGAASLGLTDMVADPSRARLYIANPGLNRIEVFDTGQQQFLTPIGVGQLPRSIALAGDGNTLYVANSGSEMLTVVDVSKLAVTGSVAFPPLPFGSTLPIVTPLLVVSTEQGPQAMMSDGSLWRVSGNTVTPRVLSPLIFGTATTVSTPADAAFAASAEGAYALLLAGNGAGYLYSASDDDFIATRQIVSTPITSTYFGPLSAGPNGDYFLAGGLQLNSSLTIVSTSDTGGPVPVGGLPAPGGPATSTTRPVSAVEAVNAQSFVRFSTPIRASASTAPTDAGLVELVNVSTQATTASANALEGPLTEVTGSARVNVSGRTMAYASASSTVYVLTTSGLSVIPLTPAGASAPQVTGGGVVNLADYTARIAPGGLVGIFGKNLAAAATYSSTPLPTVLGGVCVTLNNAAIPLLATAPAQINVQVPPTLAAGTYPLVIRSLANQLASSAVNVTVSKYAPAVFVDSQGAAIYHADGTRVDQYHPATRDEPLTVFATGLGVTTGGRVTAGVPAPSSPVASTASVALFFGNPGISNSAVIIDSSELVPGEIGVYQIACRIPGNHLSGNGLAVTLEIGGASSSTTGPDVPLVYVD
jgi:uncharacterized protein (TIGR03437 family)